MCPHVDKCFNYGKEKTERTTFASFPNSLLVFPESPFFSHRILLPIPLSPIKLVYKPQDLIFFPLICCQLTFSSSPTTTRPKLVDKVFLPRGLKRDC